MFDYYSPPLVITFFLIWSLSISVIAWWSGYNCKCREIEAEELINSLEVVHEPKSNA